MALSKEQQAFFWGMYQTAFNLTDDPDKSILCAAAATLESGWGTLKHLSTSNNYFGVKPVGDQPRMPNASHIRKFATVEDSVREWLRLFDESTHYDGPRKAFKTRLAALNAINTQNAALRKDAYMQYMHDFAEIYAPSYDASTNAGYYDNVKSIVHTMITKYPEKG